MMKIAAPHLANLLEFAASLGLEKEELKKKYLLNPRLDLALTENQVSEQEMSCILKEMLDRTGDDFLGLHYGCFMNLKALGLVYTISKSATHLEQVVLFLKSFLESTFPLFEVGLKEEAGKCKIELHCKAADEEVKRHLIDASLCILYRELHMIAGKTSPVELVLPYADAAEYKSCLGTEIRKGEGHALLFDQEQLNAALNPENLFLVGELLPSFLQLLEKAKGRKTFSDQVRAMILNMSSPQLPDLGKVAAQFCMSPRTFQRRLNGEGKSFRFVLDHIKRDLAGYLQEGSRLKTQDIAFLLGYSEASAYLHAVKKWEQSGALQPKLR